jgi:hypothetical protein
MKPTPAKPRIIIAQVVGSETDNANEVVPNTPSSGDARLVSLDEVLFEDGSTTRGRHRLPRALGLKLALSLLGFGSSACLRIDVEIDSSL